MALPGPFASWRKLANVVSSILTCLPSSQVAVSPGEGRHLVLLEVRGGMGSRTMAHRGGAPDSASALAFLRSRMAEHSGFLLQIANADLLRPGYPMSEDAASQSHDVRYGVRE